MREGGRRLRLVIVAETLLYREGLAAVLRRYPNLEVAGAAGSVEAGTELVARVRPDAVLLDVAADGGLDALENMRGGWPDVRVIAFGVAESEQVIIDWAEAGASGYVPHESDVDQLIEVIEAALHDEVVCTPRVAGTLMRRVGALARVNPAHGEPGVRLTPRETQVIALVDEGLSNKEIASRLQIGLATVKNHVHNVIDKLDATSRAEAAARIRAMRRTSPPTGASPGIPIPR